MIAAAGIDWGRFVGVPFVPRGRGFDGADCYGLAALVHREAFGLELGDLSDGYWSARGGEARAGAFLDAPLYGWLEVERGAIAAGDVLVFRVNGFPAHCGIAMDSKRMLHVLEGTDSVIESWTGPQWGPRFVQAYRRAEQVAMDGMD